MTNALDAIRRPTIGEQANSHASAATFNVYRRGLALNTRNRQDGDIARFCEFLGELPGMQCDPDAYAGYPEAWAGITWGLVQAFVEWQLREGYSIGTINLRLSTIRIYARLAHQAGFVSVDENSRIHAVRGFGGAQAVQIDAARPVKRVSNEKTHSTVMSPAHWHAMMETCDRETAIGRRDRLLLALLFDCALRVSEAIALKTSAVNLPTMIITVYRSKTATTTRMRLHGMAADALADYMAKDCPAPGPLIRRVSKHKTLTCSGITRVGAWQIVQKYGAMAGVDLSPHDGRHSRATARAEEGATFTELRDELGHGQNSTTALRYIKRAEIVDMREIGAANYGGEK